MKNDIASRISQIEKTLSIGAEIEDLRETDIDVYGIEAAEEIYKTEGVKSLQQLIDCPSTSDRVRKVIKEFLKTKAGISGERV